MAIYNFTQDASVNPIRNVKCPQCGKDLHPDFEICNYINDEGEPYCEIDDVETICDECGYNVIVEPLGCEITFNQFKVELAQLHSPNYHLGTRFFNKRDEKIWYVANIDRFKNLCYHYTIRCESCSGSLPVYAHYEDIPDLEELGFTNIGRPRSNFLIRI